METTSDKVEKKYNEEGVLIIPPRVQKRLADLAPEYNCTPAALSVCIFSVALSAIDMKDELREPGLEDLPTFLDVLEGTASGEKKNRNQSAYSELY